jgi:hypothetical protein
MITPAATFQCDRQSNGRRRRSWLDRPLTSRRAGLAAFLGADRTGDFPAIVPAGF